VTSSRRSWAGWRRGTGRRGQAAPRLLDGPLPRIVAYRSKFLDDPRREL